MDADSINVLLCDKLKTILRTKVAFRTANPYAYNFLNLARRKFAIAKRRFKCRAKRGRGSLNFLNWGVLLRVIVAKKK